MLISAEGISGVLLVTLLAGLNLIYVTLTVLMERRKLISEEVFQQYTFVQDVYKFQTKLFVFLSLLVGIALYAITLIKTNPFSPGQNLGTGFLLGMLGMLLFSLWMGNTVRRNAFFIMQFNRKHDAPAHWFVLKSSLTLILGWLATILLLLLSILIIFSGYPLYALIGVAMGGWFIVFIRVIDAEIRAQSVFEEASLTIGQQRQHPHFIVGFVTCNEAVSLQLLATTLIAPALAIAISVHHKPQGEIPFKVWWLFPLIIMALIAFNFLLFTAFMAIFKPRDEKPIPLLTKVLPLTALIFVGLPAHLWAWRIGFETMAYPVWCGLISGGLIVALLLHTAQRQSIDTSPFSMQVGGLIGLVLIMAIVLSFRLLFGFGIALFTLGLLASSSSCLSLSLYSAKVDVLEVITEGEVSERWRKVKQGFTHLLLGIDVTFALLLSILLFRLFYEKHPLPAPRADLYTHYTFIGLLIGALLPLALSAWQAGVQERIVHRLLKTVPKTTQKDWLTVKRISWDSFTALVMLGLISLATPLLLTIFWGIPAVVGLMGGIIASGFFGLVVALYERLSFLRAVTLSAVLVGVSLVAVQLTSLFLPFSELPRITKVYLASGLTAVGLVIVIWTYIVDRSHRV